MSCENCNCEKSMKEEIKEINKKLDRIVNLLSGKRSPKTVYSLRKKE